jgi:transcriptional regulator with XRE-family HTH domain
VNHKQRLPLGHCITIRGWSHVEFARTLRYSANALREIVAGKRSPHVETKYAIARALGVTPREVDGMLEATAELALAGELGRDFSRLVAGVRRVARRIKRPSNVTVVEARAGRSTLAALIRRRPKRLKLFYSRRT